MESGPLPRFVAGLRAVPTRVVGVKVGGRDSAVTITGQGARHLARLLGGDHVDDASAPDEALQYALGRRGFGDVATVREGDNVRISRITLAAAEALARAVADQRV
jgi:hypothetical protein